MATERESKVQSNSMSIIRKHRGYVYKNAQNMYTEKGRPDLTACIPVKIKRLIEMFGEDAEIGVFVGIELKRPGRLNGVSNAQKIVGNQIKDAKGLWFAIDDELIIDALMKKFVEDNNGI